MTRHVITTIAFMLVSWTMFAQQAEERRALVTVVAMNEQSVRLMPRALQLVRLLDMDAAPVELAHFEACRAAETLRDANLCVMNVLGDPAQRREVLDQVAARRADGHITIVMEEHEDRITGYVYCTNKGANVEGGRLFLERLGKQYLVTSFRDAAVRAGLAPPQARIRVPREDDRSLTAYGEATIELTP